MIKFKPEGRHEKVLLAVTVLHFPAGHSATLTLFTRTVSFAAQACYVNLCHLTLISNFLRFIANDRNIYPKSSHIAFTHSTSICLETSAVCQKLFQALVTGLLKPREAK